MYSIARKKKGKQDRRGPPKKIPQHHVHVQCVPKPTEISTRPPLPFDYSSSSITPLFTKNTATAAWSAVGQNHRAVWALEKRKKRRPEPNETCKREGAWNAPDATFRNTAPVAFYSTGRSPRTPVDKLVGAPSKTMRGQLYASPATWPSLDTNLRRRPVCGLRGAERGTLFPSSTLFQKIANSLWVHE